MHVADFDLDLFLDSVSSFARPPRAPSTVKPWGTAELRHFLEKQCALKRNDLRPKGYFVVHHDDALPILKDLSENGGKPLTLTHFDAHSDLGTGFGDTSWMEIGARILALPPKDRYAAISRHGTGGLSPANYLGYALACRWLESLTYVHHADSGDDLMPFFFRNFDIESGTMELRHVPGLAEARFKEQLRAMDHVPEPALPFSRTPVGEYTAERQFDAVILCHSPGYTPVEADELINVFQDYVDFDKYGPKH